MSLILDDVQKAAQLARLNLSASEQQEALTQLQAIFEMVAKMQSVDTEGVEPLSHPHEMALRLRDDVVSETDRTAEIQACAPSVANRLYLVPQVIES